MGLTAECGLEDAEGSARADTFYPEPIVCCVAPCDVATFVSQKLVKTNTLEEAKETSKMCDHLLDLEFKQPSRTLLGHWEMCLCVLDSSIVSVLLLSMRPVQAHLGGTASGVPVHGNQACHVNVLVFQCV